MLQPMLHTFRKLFNFPVRENGFSKATDLQNLDVSIHLPYFKPVGPGNMRSHNCGEFRNERKFCWFAILGKGVYLSCPSLKYTNFSSNNQAVNFSQSRHVMNY